MRQIIVDFGTFDIFGHSISLRIFGYGLMMVLGFLCAIAIARRRARRAGEDAEAITQLGILSLIGGVVGARIAYVIQHWSEQFATAPSPLWAVMNITSGGLIYYGGVVLVILLVVTYLLAKRLPVRRYLDILAPSLMLGLAFGRMGCLLNGCCFGGPARADWPLAMRFPMYSRPLIKLDRRQQPFSLGTDGPSPVYQHQLGMHIVVPDERLVNQRLWEYLLLTAPDRPGKEPVMPLLPPGQLHGKLSADQLGAMELTEGAVREQFELLAGGDGYLSFDEWCEGLSAGGKLLCGSEQWDQAVAAGAGPNGQLDFEQFRGYFQWRRGWLLSMFDADGDLRLTGPERKEANKFLQADQIALVDASCTQPVQPAQAMGIINALILAGLLTVFYRLRRREGQVFALMLVLYPITRFVLESIRDDNPHNLVKGVLTHNQYTSIGTVVVAVGLFFILHWMNPSSGPVWADRLKNGNSE